MNYMELKRRFENPPEGYGPVPFWSVNGSMDLPEIRASLEDLRDKGIEQVIIHPRSGLEPEYLSEGYWRGMDVIISELMRLGMKGWLYDEYNWPSGVAGGILLRERPDYRQRGLNHMVWRARKSVELKGRLVAAFDIDQSYKLIAGQEGLRTFIPPRGAGDCLLFWDEYMTDRTFATSCAPWAKAEGGVLDYLNEEAVDYFMELTHRQYEKRYGGHFGKTIIGLFTDEPQNYRGLFWCADMLDQFQKRAGYDIAPVLFHLTKDAPKAVKTRCDFYRVASELYTERYFDKVARWCEERALIFTGHLGMEENLTLLAANHGSVFNPLSPMQMPGIDILGIGHAYGKGVVNAEAPNFGPKALSSIAHLLGRRRCLVELWGGGGWAATPARLKKPLDWMFATGINFINPHLAWVSAKGLRKRDFPQSFSAQQPWWENFAPFSKYISRISALLSEGVHQARVLVLMPISGIWAASKGRGRPSAELDAVVKSVTDMADAMLSGGHDFDYLFEEAIKLYRVDGNSIVGGNERFDAVVIPKTACLCRDTISFLKKAAEAGTHIACIGPVPHLDDRGDDIGSDLSGLFDYVADGKTAVENIVDWLDDKVPPRVRVSSASGRVILTNHRKIGDTDVVFVTELTEKITAPSGPVTMRLHEMAGRRPRLWNPDDGTENSIEAKHDRDDLIITLNLSSGRSLVVAIPPEDAAEIATATESQTSRHRKEVRLENWEREPLSPNIYIIEPCILIAPRRPIRELSKLRRDRRFSTQAKIMTLLARWAIVVWRFFKPPEIKYRYERFFDFAAALGAAKTAEKLLKLPIPQLGPYEAADLMDEWAEYLNVPPGMGKIYPMPGDEYQLKATVKLDYIPDDIALIYEDIGELVSIYINDRRMDEGEPLFVWDGSNRRIPLSDNLKGGENSIVFESRQPDYPTLYPTIHGPEPLALIGSFHVAGGRISRPASLIGPLGSWTNEGLPFYSGSVKYKARVTLTEKKLHKAILKLGEVKETAEVRVNGRDAGLRLWPPYDIDITSYLSEGENEIEIIVRNTGANFFDHPRPSGLLGPVKLILNS